MTASGPGSSEPDDVLRDLNRFFADGVAAHGPTPAAVDWGSDRAQQTRFTEVMRLLDDHRVRDAVSIIDYGCGYGALAQRLVAEGRSFTYTGYDMCEPMIDAARVTIDDPRCRFVTRESDLEPADFTMASGLFSKKLDVSEDRWSVHVASTIDRLAALSHKGFAFNLLSRYADAELMRDDLFYGDPAEYFELCLRKYSRDVALLHDYGRFEFTLLVRIGSRPTPLALSPKRVDG